MLFRTARAAITIAVSAVLTCVAVAAAGAAPAVSQPTIEPAALLAATPDRAPALPRGLAAHSWAPAGLDTGEILAARDPHERYQPTPQSSSSTPPVRKPKKSSRVFGIAAAVLVIGAAYWLSSWARNRRRRR